MSRFRFGVIAFLACTSAVAARADQTEVGTTAETFLKLGTGARAIAIGEAYTAVIGDATTLSYNPAGIAEAVPEIEYTHNDWFEGAYSEHLAGLVDLGSAGSVGGNVNYLSIPSQQVTERIAETSDPTQNFAVVGSFSPYDLYATLSYANTLGTLLDYGVSLKAAGQSLDNSMGTGAGVDVGVLYRTSITGLALGASVQNLGLPVTMVHDSFNLPEITRFGATYIPLGKDMTLVAEMDMPSDAQTVLALGYEYDLGNLLYPRFGYRFDGIFNPWSAGFGIKVGNADVDFATVPYGDLGQTYRVTLAYKFGTPQAGQVPATGPTAAAPVSSADSASVTARVVVKLEQGVFAPSLGIGAGRAAVDLGPALQTPPPKGWALYVFERKAICKVVRGTGMPPDKIVWDGSRDDGSKVGAGVYPARFGLKAADGKMLFSPNYIYFTVYAAFPKLSLEWDARSIDAKKPADFRVVPAPFRIVGGDADKNLAWRLEILGPDGVLFRTYTAPLDDATTKIWDGSGDNGKAYYSNYIYEFRLELVDAQGNLLRTDEDQMKRMVFAR